MPYTYKLEKGEYCVYKKDSGEKVGCTDGNKESLKKYLGALHMNERQEQKLRQYIQKVIKEELNEGSDYQNYVQKMMDKEGIKNIKDLSDDEKKEFFNKVDKGWKGDNEKSEGIQKLRKFIQTEIRKVLKEGKKTGLYVIPWTRLDQSKIRYWLSTSDYHAVWHPRKGHYFFPKGKDTYDSLESDLKKGFTTVKANASLKRI